MKLRPLVIDEELKARVAEIVAFAWEHPYIIGKTGIPGDDPRYVLETPFGYRAVFSLTLTPAELYRDLSVSVETLGKYPNPVAVFALASEFGFTGWNQGGEPPADWLISKDVHYPAIRVVQPYET